MIKYPYLIDEEFLKTLDYQINKTLYAKIFVLNNKEQIIATIEGKTVGGSITTNSSSALRRSGSLTIVADASTYKITDINNLISIEKRIELEIGIKNTTVYYPEYNILWFPLGQFVIGGANISSNTTNIQISVALKDKMAILSGEAGGILNTATVHSPIYTSELDEEGNFISEPIRFRDLIYTIVKENTGLSADKIIIEDIDLRIKNIVRWLANDPVWIVRSKQGGFVLTTEEPTETARAKYGFNDNIGYQYVDFTYPGELSSTAGETVVSILDKIKKALGNYEYFFDTDGVFHFQQIKDFVNAGSDQDLLLDAINDKYFINNTESRSVYKFDNSAIINAFSNQPKYEQIKNDFTIWGELPESKIGIRYRVVIDIPPKEFRRWRVLEWEEQQLTERTIKRAKKVMQVYFEDEKDPQIIVPQDWRTELYLAYIANKEENAFYFSKELDEEWPKMYDVEHGKFYTDDKASYTYFFDMIDPTQISNKTIAQFAIDKIGRRPKVITDNNVNCLFSPTPGEFCFIESGTPTSQQERIECINNRDLFIQVSNAMMQNIAIGTAHNSAFDLLRSVLHESIGFNETISLTTIPIYHLEPNMRITVEDEDSDIHGDYIINNITISLTPNGTMSISAKRAVERI